MPLLIATTDLQAGMKLSEPLYSRRRVLLQAGKPLTDSDIDQLRRRYPNLSVRIQDPALDQNVEFEDDGLERTVAQQTQTLVVNSLSRVHDRLTAHAELQANDYFALQRAMHEILEFMKANPTTAAVAARCLDPETYLATHVGNVVYLSLLIAAARLDYVAGERRRQTIVQDLKSHLAVDLTALGLAAMVMDLTLLPLQKLFEKREPVTEEESQILLNHPEAAAEALPESFPPVARMSVRQHHENMGGMGYPKQLPGAKIHVFARILRIADAFDAATAEGVLRGARTPARALWEMTSGPYRGFYDAQLIAALGSLVQPFPIGAILKLSDGRGAVVVRYNRTNPFDPVVIISFDDHGNPLPKEQLGRPFRLSSQRSLRIKSFRGEDLSYIYTSQTGLPAAPRTQLKAPLQALYP